MRRMNANHNAVAAPSTENPKTDTHKKVCGRAARAVRLRRHTDSRLLYVHHAEVEHALKF